MRDQSGERHVFVKCVDYDLLRVMSKLYVSGEREPKVVKPLLIWNYALTETSCTGTSDRPRDQL